MALLDTIKPQTEGQTRLVETLRNEKSKVVGIFGPTGCGKSLFSLAYGIDSVSSGRYRRFIITKPLIDVVTGHEITMVEAGDEYFKMVRQYVMDVIGQFISADEIDNLIKSEKMIFSDGRYLKGRTFDESLIFVDDAHYAKPETLIELIVRLGSKSRLIIAGDPIFQALKGVKEQAISTIREILLTEEEAAVVDLGVKDIVREGAKSGIRLFLEYVVRSRKLSESEVKILDVIKTHAPDAEVLTVLDLDDLIQKHNLSEFKHLPSVLIVAKQGYLGRLVGRGGERIAAIENELKKRVRAMELDLTNLPSYIRALHPITWIWKRIEADFMGVSLTIKVNEDDLGPLLGQRGAYVRFIEDTTMRLLGIGVKVLPVKAEVKEARKKETKRK